MIDTVYVYTNTVSTRMKYARGSAAFNIALKRSNAGTCAALSAVWLKNIASERIELTKPDPLRSQIIYQRCVALGQNEYAPHAFNLAVMKNVGIFSTGGKSHEPAQAFEWMGSNPGKYYIHAANHAVAASTVDGFFFFDPNHACWSYGSAKEFEDHAREHMRKAVMRPLNGRYKIYSIR